MSSEADPLVLDFVEWIAREPRTLCRGIATWKTSCPRLTIFEDATEHGYRRAGKRCGKRAVHRGDSSWRGVPARQRALRVRTCLYIVIASVSEAIQNVSAAAVWIASSLRSSQ